MKRNKKYVGLDVNQAMKKPNLLTIRCAVHRRQVLTNHVYILFWLEYRCRVAHAGKRMTRGAGVEPT